MLKRKPDDSFSGKSAETRARLKAMAKVAERLSSWKPARTELREVRSLETIFVQVDHAVRVGGWPLDRFALVHGPSSHGKTQFVHGLGASFLAAGSYYAYVDAEYTTPASWVRKLLGEFVDYPGFIAHRPRTYEETVSAVRQFCTEIAEARARGELPEDSTGLVVVDSIRKLNPKKLLDSLLAAEVADGKEKKKRGGGRYGKKEASIDGAGGRAGQIKASLNAAWLDELIPLLAHTGTAAAFISRETDDTDVASVFGRDGKDLSDRFRGKVGGGRALLHRDGEPGPPVHGGGGL